MKLPGTVEVKLAAARFMAVFCCACSPCSTTGLQEGGATPYTRCIALEGERHTWRVGSAHADLQGRVLHTRGIRALRVFSVLDETGLAELAREDDLPWFVVGGLARRSGAAARGFITSQSRLVLYLPGGDDIVGHVEELMESENVVVLTTATTWSTEYGTWGLLPGSEDGRFTDGAEGCGFRADDLAGRLEDLRGVRSLVSWQNPSDIEALRSLDFDAVLFAFPPLAREGWVPLLSGAELSDDEGFFPPGRAMLLPLQH